MIIIDTSVWVEFFKNNSLYYPSVREMLENQSVLTIDCIFAELLQGARNQNERDVILSYWNNVPVVDIENLYINAGIYSSENKLISRGIGLIDSVIIVSSNHYKAQVWTLDKKLKSALKKENVYQSPL